MRDLQPVSEVLSGVMIPPLPEGVMIVGTIMIVKGLTAEGESAWFIRRSDGVDDFQMLGALRVMLRRHEDDVLDGWTADEDDE